MTKVDHIAFLLYKELEGKLSEAESTELEAWKTENPDHLKLFDEMMDEGTFAALIKRHHPENKEAVRENILAKMDPLDFKVIPLVKRSFFRIAAAACIALLITVEGYFMFFKNKQGEEPTIAKTNDKDVPAPASDKAVIKLPDGTEILVDSLTTYTQGNVTVTKLADGRLVYSGLGTEVMYNTLTNPRGSVVRDITLADGTQIWLNAGSSITYPVAFSGNERKVSMTGEAFFKVAHNASMPFTLTRKDMSVTVLGTEFNVNAYDDEEDIKVTLLSGSVRTKLESGAVATLKPGQQAKVSNSIQVVSNVNLDHVIAWKNGRFEFSGLSVEQIMRQFSRWYDVEIVYQEKLPALEFVGDPSRQQNISEALKVLEATDKIHFKIEGKRVFVSK